MRKQLFAGALLIAVPALIAASAMPLTFGSGSRVWVRAPRPSAAGAARARRSAARPDAASTELAQIGPARGEITIPLSTLDCRNGTMNGHMRTALKAQQNPTIRFRATARAGHPGGAMTA